MLLLITGNKLANDVELTADCSAGWGALTTSVQKAPKRDFSKGVRDVMIL